MVTTRSRDTAQENPSSPMRQNQAPSQRGRSRQSRSNQQAEPTPVQEPHTSPAPARARAPPARGRKFLTNPYEGDIDPSDEKYGLNLFMKAIEPRPPALTVEVSQKYAKELLQMFEADSTSFAWGELVHTIPIAQDTQGLVTVSKSVIRNYTEVTLDQVKLQALKIWGDKKATLTSRFPTNLIVEDLDPENSILDHKTFFLRVRSRMIAKRIEGSITVASWNSLLQKKSEFAWLNARGNFEYDGPTMLKIIITAVKPSTRVGVSDITLEIQNSRLNKYNYDVKQMLDDMNHNYQSLTIQNHQHPNYILDLFHALLSAKNDEFRDFIQRMKDEWEGGKDIKPEELMETATSKYNNMIKQNSWGRINPKDAKIVALATKLKRIESSLTTSEKSYPKHSNKSNIKLNVDKWRIIKDRGETFERDGKQWWWCPHHKLEGHFDGLYMNHPPSQHNKWKEEKKKKRDEYKKKRDENRSNNKNSKSSVHSNQLQLSEKMRAALVTNFQCTDSEADSVWQEMSQNFG